ncbi:hypothetical protein SAMN05661012_04633 [Chitinophaga sancti]|uniref:Uncharacterized protein n=1 Tax=Chitinophaga sancti TaxID=1004 RepID=A0A1K1S1Z7_9BACT|nr:hypothetical protein SAMN05661012_04633 [Chitinophaga sancti]
MEIHGKAGIIALGFFKLRWLGTGIKSMDASHQEIEILHGKAEDDVWFYSTFISLTVSLPGKSTNTIFTVALGGRLAAL